MTEDETKAGDEPVQGEDVRDDSEDPVRTLGGGDAAERVREALDTEEDVDGPVGPVSATPDENSQLEHTMGGATTRDDLLDQGVPMLQGDAHEQVGPEDAGGEGPKRGDYSSRVLPSLHTHEAVRIDGASSAAGPQVTNEDGGIETLPHTVLRPQAPRFSDQGEEPGEKGGVTTDPNHPDA